MCDVRVDYVGLSHVKKSNFCFRDLLSRFQVANLYRLEFMKPPLRTWANKDGSATAHLDRISI